MGQTDLGRSTEQTAPQDGNRATLEGAVAVPIGQVLCCTQCTLAGLNREAVYKGHWVAQGLTESWRTSF